MVSPSGFSLFPLYHKIGRMKKSEKRNGMKVRKVRKVLKDLDSTFKV